MTVIQPAPSVIKNAFKNKYSCGVSYTLYILEFLLVMMKKALAVVSSWTGFYMEFAYSFSWSQR